MIRQFPLYEGAFQACRYTAYLHCDPLQGSLHPRRLKSRMMQFGAVLRHRQDCALKIPVGGTSAYILQSITGLRALIDRHVIGYSLGPTYSALGRIRRLSSYCSRICAVQPDTRLIAKIGVNRSRGISSAVYTRSRIEVDIRLQPFLDLSPASRSLTDISYHFMLPVNLPSSWDISADASHADRRSYKRGGRSP